MKLVHKPRSGRRQHTEILTEVRGAYKVLGNYIIDRLNQDVVAWSHKPAFKLQVVVNTKRWMITVKVDRRTKSGKIWTWVDEGTGERGDDPSGKAYDIYPKKKKALSFLVPHVPKTIPSVIKGLDIPGIVMTEKGGLSAGEVESQNRVNTQHVHAPGIRPRHFSKSLVDEMKQKRPGSFKNVTEAAVKKGLRRIGKRIK